MNIHISDETLAYIQSKGADSLVIDSIHRRSCCTVDYSATVRTGMPTRDVAYHKMHSQGIELYVSGFITGLEEKRDLTVKLVDLKLKKMLILDKNE